MGIPAAIIWICGCAALNLVCLILLLSTWLRISVENPGAMTKQPLVTGQLVVSFIRK
jgi:hypothetical protein